MAEGTEFQAGKPIGENSPVNPEPAPGKNGSHIKKLLEPINSAGRTITELNLDFQKLKLKGLKAVAAQFRLVVPQDTLTDGERAIPWVRDEYQMMCVARLNGIIYEDLDNLCTSDALEVEAKARSFFLAHGQF